MRCCRPVRSPGFTFPIPLPDILVSEESTVNNSRITPSAKVWTCRDGWPRTTRTPRSEGRRLATKGTKSTKGRSRFVVLPFVLFVPFVANLLPSPLANILSRLGRAGLGNSTYRPWIGSYAAPRLNAKGCYGTIGLVRPTTPSAPSLSYPDYLP